MDYNINVISFLISTFDEIVATFGINTNAINFYKNQVNNLVSIGQVTLKDARIIFELLNFSNIDDPIKWEQEMKKKGYFVDTVNEVLCANGNKDVITYILQQKVVQLTDTSFMEVICIVGKIFDVVISNENYKQIARNINFGTTKFKGFACNTSGKKQFSLNMECNAFKEKLVTCGAYNEQTIVKVKNLEAVCSCDESYYEYNLIKLLSTERDDLVSLWNAMQNGANIKVGEYVDCGEMGNTQWRWLNNAVATALFAQYLSDIMQDCSYKESY